MGAMMPALNTNILIFNPHIVTRQLMLGEEPVIFRLLHSGDGELLGRYFESLSDETRRRYGPHPLTAEEAQNLCDNLNYHDTLRFVAFKPGTAPEIIAYFILQLGITEHEMARYASYGIELDTSLDCTFAPSVSDAYQDRGLGSLLMRPMIDSARRLGKRAIVLMGGTQATNERAIHFYEKFDFRRVGGFRTDVDNYDMILYLT